MAANDVRTTTSTVRPEGSDGSSKTATNIIRRALAELVKVSLLLPTLTFWITPELKDLLAKGGSENAIPDATSDADFRTNMVSCWQNFALVVSQTPVHQVLIAS
jgi:hypothetical protein